MGAYAPIYGSVWVCAEAAVKPPLPFKGGAWGGQLDVGLRLVLYLRCSLVSPGLAPGSAFKVAVGECSQLTRTFNAGDAV